jgi:uncharacterized surface protein with fasciclin (FAS1) repeats
MLKFGKLMLAVLAAGYLTTGNSVAQTTPATSATTAMQASQSILETASANPQFSTLVTAIKAAGLTETLSGTGPFTVFAPTNAAFEALPAGTLEELLKPENKEKLQTILTNHVISGKTVKSTDLQDGQSVKAVGGQDLNVSLAGGKAMIDGASVSKADLMTSNGVIHVIDKVILPEDVDANK